MTNVQLILHEYLRSTRYKRWCRTRNLSIPVNAIATLTQSSGC
ncbi:MAG: hypothetical protein ACFB02_01535 [Mastigocoleus sp.]